MTNNAGHWEAPLELTEADRVPEPREPNAGVRSMERLADRLTALAPPPIAARLAGAGMPPRFSPAVEAGLARGRALAADAAQRANSPRSFTGRFVDSFVSACAFIPYALVALVLRLVMAREFFLSGQSKIDGPRVPLNILDFQFSVTLPLQVKYDTITLFLTKYAALPLPTTFAAYTFSFAEFILPVCLVLGFGTRFAAFGLLALTALLQVYVSPDMLWTTHVYWAAILLVLLSRGPGQISIDHIIRFIARR